MNVLILGGTHFLGRHLTEYALERGHQVTLFNRGKTNPDLFPQVEKLIGDRDSNLDALEGRTWDVAIDTNGYVPRIVRKSVRKLADCINHYTFISTISVYQDMSQLDMDEGAEVSRLKDEGTEEVTGETYGPLKALCEEEVVKVFPEKSLIVRPGLIVGPYDPTDRFTYWPVRIARGGEVLAPGKGNAPIQYIDVRDLARWILEQIEEGTTGTFNTAGPSESIHLHHFLNECKKVAEELGKSANLNWVDEQFLLENEVVPWSEMPFWISDDGNHAGMLSINFQKAIALDKGLQLRPLAETIRDTIEWSSSRGVHYEWKAGISSEKEASLLEKLKQGSQAIE
ncbi:NAD-dependent epimerase/dehydratase family protein [Bacillus horti]|uniref:2'-hydroxyisoflavone reductase n=1 Tax=Caldalkalibacillus horti TaxID=77523 RepID=A0ABT9VYL2_9BACI|nr:NAD-dependent epimerase/dehydratase family protein [Bacillus horti]MDQ0165917.1 2'-hydroxyisoflavone reductase [Bacillus horti]